MILDAECSGLKIRVSVVRFRPWPPFRSAAYIDQQAARAGDVSTLFPVLLGGDFGDAQGAGAVWAKGFQWNFKPWSMR
jgi:hypothetical protein